MSKIALEGNASGTGTFTIASPNSNSNYTLTLPNSTGTLVVTGGAQTIEFAAGTAAAPSITFTGDTNTGIFSPGADTIAFSEGGAEAMRIDSSGNVGIGTSSPSDRLQVNGASAANTQIRVVSTATAAERSSIEFFNNTVSRGRVGGANDFDGLTLDSSTTESAAVIRFRTGGGTLTERMRINSSGNVGIGTTSPSYQLQIKGSDNTPTSTYFRVYSNNESVYTGIGYQRLETNGDLTVQAGSVIAFASGGTTERARITSGGDFLVGMTTVASTSNGFYVNMSTAANAHALVCNNRSDGSGAVFYVNRNGSDGTLIDFRQADITEGTISVSGTTVSYNGGHLSRWAQTQGPKDDTLVKGTVLSNLDEMNVYTDAEGNPVSNEQLNKVKVSDVEGDVNVAGVFVNWSYDEQHQVDEINMAMTGDMIIRIAQGVVVQKGDLLMSAGDGTAKPQGDDIVRSKTVAKVTSNHVTCTYEDGSYCVPCVLMAC